MAITIRRAVKYGSLLRMALYGPSGSGKTFWSLKIAHEMAGDKRVCLIDTERGSASKYADIFPDFDVIELDSYHPNSFIEAIQVAVQAGEYGVLVLDSISHEWEGSKGALELAGRDFTNWAKVTPLHNAFVDAMLRANIHVIATMRAKEEYAMVKEEGKRAEVHKVGIEPIQRKGIQYEFDISASLDMENMLTIEKSRCSALAGQAIMKQDTTLVPCLKAWLDGEPMPERKVSTATLNEIFAMGKNAGLYVNVQEFGVYAQLALGIDFIPSVKELTEAQAKDVEASIKQRIAQSAAA